MFTVLKHQQILLKQRNIEIIELIRNLLFPGTTYIRVFVTFILINRNQYVEKVQLLCIICKQLVHIVSLEAHRLD